VAEFVDTGILLEFWSCVQIIVPRRQDASGLHKAMEEKFPNSTVVSPDYHHLVPQVYDVRTVHRKNCHRPHKSA
jgi:hypothetical protein